MERPLRADARRNRERILEAARSVFIEEGADVQMEPIARRAGVGIGTVYRNFPTKQCLMTEVARQWVCEREAATARALELDDPVKALHQFIRESAEAMHHDAGIRRVLNDHGKADPEADAAHLRQLELMLDRLRPTGEVRADLTPTDLFGLMCGMAFAIHRGATPQLTADILLRGIRPPS